MTVLMIIVSAIALLAGLVRGGLEVYSRRKYSLSLKKHNKLSLPAQRIVEAYAKLPEESKRYNNIHYLLDALDTKYGVGLVNEHFTPQYYYDREPPFVWNHQKCYTYGSERFACRYAEYHEMIKSIEQVQEAHEKREHAIKMAGVAGGLDAVKEFTNQLREESSIINQSTKELA